MQCMVNCSVVSNSLWPHGLQPTRLLSSRESMGFPRMEWVSISYCRSSWPGGQTHVSYISCHGRLILYHYTTWGSQKRYGHILKLASCGSSYGSAFSRLLAFPRLFCQPLWLISLTETKNQPIKFAMYNI